MKRKVAMAMVAAMAVGSLAVPVMAEGRSSWRKDRYFNAYTVSGALES